MTDLEFPSCAANRRSCVHRAWSAIGRLVEELPDGLEPVAKAKRLATIEAELLLLESEEEEVIVELEQAGETVLRRADARPEIILA